MVDGPRGATTPRRISTDSPGGEGAFIPCTCWLADCLALAERDAEARELFELVLDVRNDVGLLSEEYDTCRRRMVGDLPGASFSHVSVIGTAQKLISSAGRSAPPLTQPPAPRRRAAGGASNRAAGADDPAPRTLIEDDGAPSPRRRDPAGFRRLARADRRGSCCGAAAARGPSRAHRPVRTGGGATSREVLDVPKLEVVGLYGLSAHPPLDDDVRSGLAAVAGAEPGVELEDDAVSIALHARRAPEPEAALDRMRPAVRAPSPSSTGWGFEGNRSSRCRAPAPQGRCGAAVVGPSESTAALYVGTNWRTWRRSTRCRGAASRRAGSRWSPEGRRAPRRGR